MKSCRVFLVMLMAVGFVFNFDASAESVPYVDWAYPKDVAQNARQDYDNAVKEKNDAKAVAALMRIGLAETVVDPDSIVAFYSRLDKIAKSTRNDVTRSVLQLLQAKVLRDFYYDINRRANSRPTLADNRPINEMSGNQLNDSINSLLTMATGDYVRLSRVPATEWRDVFTINENVADMYPTLYDVMCCIAANSHQFDYKTSKHIAYEWMSHQVAGSPQMVAALLSSYTTDAPKWETVVSDYNVNRQTPFAVQLLLAADYLENWEEAYKLFSEFVTRYPDYININEVKNAIAKITLPAYKMSVKSYRVCIGDSIDIGLKVNNARSVTVALYKSPAMKVGFIKSLKQLGEPIIERTLDFDKEIPYYGYETGIKLPVPGYGEYILAGRVDGGDIDSEGTIRVTVSDIFTIESVANGRVFTVNAATGIPLKGVKVVGDGWDASVLGRMESNREGMVCIPDKGEISGDKTWSLNLKPVKGMDVYAEPFRYYDFIKGNNYTSQINDEIKKYRYQCNIITSQSVYHPGDTIEGVALVSKYNVDGSVPCDCLDLVIELRDVNGNTVSTSNVTTDRWGRALIKFAVPRDGITGRYDIGVSSEPDDAPDAIGRLMSWTGVMVSDYKQSTFFVNIDPLTIAGDSVSVSGKVMSYTGLPLAAARVKMKATLKSYSDPGNMVSVDSVTDVAGAYRFMIPLDSLVNATYQNILNVEVAVTSPNGETVIATQNQRYSDKWKIYIYSGVICADSTDADLNIDVRDWLDRTVDSDVMLKWVNCMTGEVIEMTGVSKGGNVSIDTDGLPSGEYDLTVSTHDASAKAVVVVYRSDDRYSPSGKSVWVPLNNIACDNDARHIDIPVAFKDKDDYILATLMDKGEVVKQWWITGKQGMETIRVALPDEINNAAISFVCVKNYAVDNATVRLVRKKTTGLNITVNTLRDHIFAPHDETVTVSVTATDGNPVESAVICDIYNRALDAVEANNNRLHIDKLSYQNYLPFCYFNGNRYVWVSGKVTLLPDISFEWPQFNLYGLEFGSKSSYRRVRLNVRSSAAGSYNGGNEYKYEEQEMYFSVAEADESVATTYAESKAVLNDSGIDEKTTDEAVALESESGGIAGEKVDYRDVDVALAMFEPMLQTDGEGNLTLEIKFPNALATWAVNMWAFDREYAIGTYIKDVVASKPVTVSANVPRFIRRGDRLTVVASVVNATDNSSDATVIWHLHDMLTMNELMPATECNLHLDANGHAEVSLPVEALSQWDNIVLTVEVKCGNYSDGERHLIPVLDAMQPIIESETFYLSPDQPGYERNLDVEGDDAVTMLSFTANPTWEVVKALPAVRDNQATTSVGAAANLFSLAVGQNIISKNSHVVESIRQWLQSSPDSTMLSNLTRNEELRQMVLAQTPWGAAAVNISERMSRLALLFDAEDTDFRLSRAWTSLDEFVGPDGGFKWIGRMEGESVWATELILNMLGRLNDLKYIDYESHRELIDGAMRYLDDKVCETALKYSDITDLNFAWLCSQWPGYRPSALATNVVNRTVKRLAADWRNAGLGGKAVAAMLLNRNGDNRVARQILKSLMQYSICKPDAGRWWPSLSSGDIWSRTPLLTTATILDAFGEIEPDSDAVDEIRQWLVFNKITQGWGDSSGATDVIASILSTGSDWIDGTGFVQIRVDDTRVEPDLADSLTGAILAVIPGDASRLSVSREECVPAWGAVMTKSTKRMAEVKAHDNRDLSVDKRLYVKRGDQWVETTDMRVGDIVKVVLTVIAQKRIDYVTVSDNRAATMEPVIMTPRMIWNGGIPFYIENRDAVTNLFIDVLPKGTYVIDYEMKVNNAGEFASGVATVQSQYAPEITAHSSGSVLTVGGKE